MLIKFSNFSSRHTAHKKSNAASLLCDPGCISIWIHFSIFSLILSYSISLEESISWYLCIVAYVDWLTKIWQFDLDDTASWGHRCWDERRGGCAFHVAFQILIHEIILYCLENSPTIYEINHQEEESWTESQQERFIFFAWWWLFFLSFLITHHFLLKICFVDSSAPQQIQVLSCMCM